MLFIPVLDFWRYPMSFFPLQKMNGEVEISQAKSSNCALQEKTLNPSFIRMDQKDIKLANNEKILPCDSTSKSINVKVQESTAIPNSQEISSLLDDTILGLEEVGDLLQASLKEIEKERVSSDNPTDSKTRPISKILQENDIFLHSIDREKTQPIISEDDMNARGTKNNTDQKGHCLPLNNNKQLVTNSRFPISKQQNSFIPSATKSTYNKVVIAKEVNCSPLLTPKVNHSNPTVPPVPPLRTSSSRQSSPALSPRIDRKQNLNNESSRSGPPTAAAALLDEIRNSITSPTPFTLHTDGNNYSNHHSEPKRVPESCQIDNNSFLVNQSTNVGNVRKISARQTFNKASLKIVPDCRHPQSTSPTPTTSPTVSPQPQPGMTSSSFQSPNRLSMDSFSTNPKGVRKHSSPPVFFNSTSTSISPNRNFANGIDDSYCRSSILDKMSDYEDIWNDTLPASKDSLPRPDRSMTPAESENQFKAYLASKLLSSPSNSPSINNVSSNSFDCEKSRSITSSRSSTNTNKSNYSNTSESSSLSSTTISHSSPHSSTQADFSNIQNVETSQVSQYLVKQSPLLTSKPRFIQSSNDFKVDTRNRKISLQYPNQSKKVWPDIEVPSKPKPSPTLSHHNFYNKETISILTSSTSSSARSTSENANKMETKKNNTEEDPVYSDPLDALEKETDTRIYHSPAFENHEEGIENIYEEASHDKRVTENNILQPLIESDHESSDSSSNSSSFSSSMSSIAKEKYLNSKNKKAPHGRRKSSLDNSLTNLSQFEKLFTSDASSNGISHAEQKSETVCSDKDYKEHKIYNRSHSLSMEDLNKAATANDIGYPLSQVRKTSVSSYEEKCSKKRRKSSIKSISLKRRERSASVAQNSNRNSNRLSAVIGKYIRPTSVVNQLEVPKSTTWQLDSSSWEFLGQKEDSKDVNVDIDSNISIHVNPMKTDTVIDANSEDNKKYKCYNSPGNTILENEPTTDT